MYGDARWFPCGSHIWMVLAAAASILTAILAGCSVYVAANQPSKKDLHELRQGAPRSAVLKEFGQPVSSEMKDDKRVDIVSFTQGYTEAEKASRAMFHAAADVFTTGLWEVVGTPAEAVFTGRQMTFEITYDAHDQVETVSPPCTRVQISQVLVAYSYTDGEFADTLAAKLTARKVRFRGDMHDAPSPSDSPLDPAQLVNPTVLLVVSPHSVGSPWLKGEADQAANLEGNFGRQVLYPIGLDDAWKTPRLPRRLQTHGFLRLNDWKDQATSAQIDGFVDALPIFYTPRCEAKSGKMNE